MKTLILILVFVNSLIIPAQEVDYINYNQYLMDAYRAKDKKDYSKALKLYEKAFEINGAKAAINYLNATLCASELNDKDKAHKYLKLAITEHKIERDYIEGFSKHHLYMEVANDILKDYERYLDEFYETIKHPRVYIEIQGLLNRDQFSRKVDNYYYQRTDEDEEIYFDLYLKAQAQKDTTAIKKYKKLLWPTISDCHKDFKNKAMVFADSLNTAKLLDITKTYGWQKEGWIILWHQRGTYGENNWVWNSFKPIIDKEISEGKISPSFWAQFEDHKALFSTGKTIYGYFPGPLNPDTVNIKRKEIGLPPLTKEEIDNRMNRRDKGRLF